MENTLQIIAIKNRQFKQKKKRTKIHKETFVNQIFRKKKNIKNCPSTKKIISYIFEKLTPEEHKVK